MPLVLVTLIGIIKDIVISIAIILIPVDDEFNISYVMIL